MPPECEETEDRGVPEKISCIDGRIKDPLSRFTTAIATSKFRGRRAMVKRLWCQEIARKWFYRKDGPPYARVFTEPRCQSYVATWYLSYRWLIFVAWACIIVCSIFEFGSYNPLLVYEKWPIYLTNWDLVLGLGQALLGGLLVSRRWRLQNICGFDPSSMSLGSAEKVYWFLYVVTTNIAIGVTVSYWCGVYNPKIHHVDPLNLMLHVCNSILMIVDFCVTGVPFRLRNFWWCLTLVFSYILFSLLYYLLGGLDKNGYHYIYKILDWKNPLRTTLICVGEIMFVIVLHSLVCLLARIKDRLYRKIDRKLGRTLTDTGNTALEKQADIV